MQSYLKHASNRITDMHVKTIQQEIMQKSEKTKIEAKVDKLLKEYQSNRQKSVQERKKNLPEVTNETKAKKLETTN